jgi:tetratricopeptide (TPR) repeat protein
VPVTAVQVQFLQTGYMDSATLSATVPRIPPHSSVTVPVKAVFNDRIFSGEGARKVTGELILSYMRSGKPAEQRIPVIYELLDRRAISWDDDRKVAAFVTPQDSALKNFTAHLSRIFRDSVLPNWNQPIQIAMQTFAGLATLDLLYQEDASSPFTKVQGTAQAVDLVNAARETLARRYGDCDDLTVLFCSMLETRNVESGFITVPGHILPAFNTGIRTSDYALIHPDRSMTIPIDGELWIPVEATLLSGKNGYLEAWKRGAEYWSTNEGNRVFNATRKAQLVFSPIPLEERDLGLQYGDTKRTFSLFETARDEVGFLVIKSYKSMSEKSGNKVDFNKLGILSASLDKIKDAEEAFSRALKIDSKYLPAIINLGNLQFLRKEYAKAVSIYKSALAQSSASSSPKTSHTLLINLARSYSALGQAGLAKEMYGQAVGIDPERSRAFAYLGGVDASTSRAAEATAEGKIQFTEEE